MSRIVNLALVVMALTSCKSDDRYCPGAPLDNCNLLDSGTDAPPRCTDDQQCHGSLAVCDLATTTCVQCTPSEALACSGTTPACLADTCQACTAHSQCASNACLPDGACGDDTDVAYVDPAGTDNALCTKAMPCLKVASALATSRPFVKFHGVTDEAVSVNGGRTVSFLADPGAKLTRTSGNGAILTVQDDATSLSIYDLSISNAPNSAGGIGCVIPTASGAPTLALTRVTIMNNPGGGISTSGGTLMLSQSTVSGNTGGGISISGSQFDITNDFIVGNGGPQSGIGGLNISQILTSGTHRLDFNTITGNAGLANVAVNTGVNCATIGVPLVFDSNIIIGNPVTGSGKQLGGDAMCTAIYSDVGDSTPGTGNIDLDPRFVNPAQNDFHLMATSPAKDTADPAATLTVDIDGDTRPQGPARDMGADEVKQ